MVGAFLTLMALIGVNPAAAQVSVPTHHYDNFRTGWNQHETTLTTASVNSTSFGLLRTVAVDDQVDAQPLVHVLPSGQTVIYVATASNTIYEIDPNSGTVLHQINLGPPVPQTMVPGACTTSGPNVGVTGTPVIAGGTMYLITYTLENSAPVYRVRAIRLSSLQEQSPGGVVVTASHTLTDGTTYNFDPITSRQRPALLYANGNIYAGFASFCDLLGSIQRGWLLGWTASTLTPLPSKQLNNTLATEPSTHPAFRVSIWMSGAGPAADERGNLYFVTGNSGQGSTYSPPDSIQESVVKMSPDLSNILGIFTPSNYASLDQTDLEFGAGGILVIPPQPLPRPYLATAAGKDGNMYLLNRRAFGGLTTLPTELLGTVSIGACFCSPSYFMGADGISRIVSSGGGNVIVWKLQSTGTGVAMVQESQSPTLTNRPGFFTSVSSNGRLAGSAIIWAVTHPSATAPLNLVALNASNSQVIYSAIAGPWSSDHHPNTVPVVANGLVLVGTYKQLAIFGPAGAQPSGVIASAQLATSARQGAPSVPLGAPISSTLVSGTIVRISGSVFELKTSAGLKEVDATQAVAAQLAADLYVGRSVEVRGNVNSAGVLVAEAVYPN